MTRLHTRGFTLIETLIVIVLFVAITIVLTVMYVHFGKFYSLENAQAETAASAGRIINEAKEIVLPAESVVTSHSFSSATYSSNASTLVVEIPSIDSSGNVISGTYDYAVIYVSGTTAYRTLQAANPSSRRSGTKQLSDTVSSLTFTYNNVDFTQVTRVSVDITTQALVKDAPIQAHLTNQIYLRNHD